MSADDENDARNWSRGRFGSGGRKTDASRRTVWVPPEQAAARGLDKLLACRSEIPAVTHVDGSARLQTVDAARHGRYHRLLRRFEARTGCPVVINTSFNVRGEPIVCRPADAWQCFLGTNMDALVLERFLLLREEQPQAPEHAVDEYLARFQPD